MTDRPGRFLCDRVLIDSNVVHGFGERGVQPPEKTAFPIQVHGKEIFTATSVDAPERPEADIVITTTPGVSVGIVTADCIPVLVAARDGSAVGAIHAGWRGLVAGVLEVGLQALRESSGCPDLVAAVGPGARGCCYEVDDAVRSAVGEKYSDGLSETLRPGRTGHFLFDLAALATWILEDSGVDCHQLGVEHRVCTICAGERFESFRRDGEAAGRLVHFITRPHLPGPGLTA